MLKLYIYPRLPNAADSKLLRLLLSKEEFEGKLFQQIPAAPFKDMVQFVDSVDEAHYILLAHEYYFVKHEDTYLKSIDDFALQHNKKVIIFDYGDVIDKVKVENSIVLRTAAYKTSIKDNEIIIPPFVEDLALQSTLTPRVKNTDSAVVGFAGMVHLPSYVQELKYQLRIYVAKIKIMLFGHSPAALQGLYFRRKVIRILKNCKECTTNFIIRNSFSAHEKTISADPVVLRQEYLDTLQNSDLNLVIRGDGNYSLRFFEVLSLGRIPLFIDTDSPLPFADEINYDDFMLRVDYKDISKVPEIIETFWQNLTPQRYVEMQKRAREIFETHLRPDAFYQKIFSKLETMYTEVISTKNT